MVEESLDEYVLDSTEAYHEGPRKQAPIVSISSGLELHEAVNASRWFDRRQPEFPRPN